MPSVRNALTALAATLVAAIVAGPIMSKVEEPPYRLIRRNEPFEIRAYPEMIVAEISEIGPRKAAISSGFRAIAGFIFGGNPAGQKIAMTAPVLQEPDSTTAPERLEGTASWKVRFIMPRNWSLQTLPQPANAAITLRAIPGEQFVVVRYSGLAGDVSVDSHLGRLRRYAAEQGLTTQGAPVLAFYDPPWTLPFLRRNEIMLALSANSRHFRCERRFPDFYLAVNA